MPVTEVKPTLDGMRLPSTGATHACIGDAFDHMRNVLSDVVAKYRFFSTEETITTKLVVAEDDSKRGLVGSQDPVIDKKGILTFEIDLTRSENFQKQVGRIPEDVSR